MKTFFLRLIFYFLVVSAIDIIVDLIFYQSIESTILAGHIRTIVFTFIVVFIGTIVISLMRKSETADNS